MNRVFSRDHIRNEALHNQPQKLRPGQIITGRIQKIYPNQKAEVQLGQTRLIARLEAPLTVGNSYHLEVDFAKDTILLKMIAQVKNNSGIQSAEQLLKNLGVQATTKEIQFVQQLMKENILFTKDQVRNALFQLNQFKDINQIERILSEMIRDKLPLKPTIIQARAAVHNESLQQMMKNSAQELEQLLRNEQSNEKIANKPLQQGNLARGKTVAQNLIDSIKGSLLLSKSSLPSTENMHNSLSNQAKELLSGIQSKLELFSSKKITTTDLYTREIQKAIVENPRLFTYLKSTALIPANVTKDQWIKHWNTFIHEQVQQFKNGESRPLQLPFDLKESTLINAIRQQRSFNQIVDTFENKWSHILSRDTVSPTMTNKEYRTLLREFNHIVQLSGLNNQGKESLANHLQAASNKNQAVHIMNNWLATNRFNMEQLLTRPVAELFQQPSESQTITSFIKSFLNESGMLNEYHLAHTNNSAEQLQQTLKSQIIQLMNGKTASNLEHLPRLIHMVNGMQLQSVVDMNQLVHTVLQLPGEPLGLNKDIQVEFSSRRKENGELDAEFCRVLFYLDLAKLEETVIDMNVQKRSVLLTIYNDVPQLEAIVSHYRSRLEDALKSIDYQLQSIAVKPSQSKHVSQSVGVNPYQGQNYEGYDYKI